MEHSSRNQETDGRQEKGRNFADADSNREVGGSPNDIDNREGQKCFPRGSMFFAIHTRFLPTDPRIEIRISGWLSTAMSRPNVHQIWQRIAEGLAIGSPSLQPNARANSGILEGAAMAR